MAYNASFWARCKSLAVLILQESKLRIGIMGDLFDRAISKYEDTAKSLSRLSQLFPLQTEATLEIDEHHQDEGMLLLKTAQDSETRGLSEIKRILDEIYKIW
ncbi:hypothetical protein D3C78_1679950 [compost metagenome]